GDLYYEERGEGPPLLLVPGLSGLGSFWASQVEAFSRDFRVVVHDHRGTGRSSHSRIEYSVEQMAADVLALMDRLGIARAFRRPLHGRRHRAGARAGSAGADREPRPVRDVGGAGCLLPSLLRGPQAGPPAVGRGEL